MSDAWAHWASDGEGRCSERRVVMVTGQSDLMGACMLVALLGNDSNKDIDDVIFSEKS